MTQSDDSIKSDFSDDKIGTFFGQKFLMGSLSTGGVGSFRPLGYLVLCVVGACCRQGFVFGGVVLEFGKCWVVVSIARGLYGAKRGSRRVWVCVNICARAYTSFSVCLSGEGYCRQ